MSAKGFVIGFVAIATVLGFAALAAAQPADMVLVGEGRVMHRAGNVLIVDVSRGEQLGMREFQITSESEVVFYKGGQKVEVFALNRGDTVAAYRPPEAVVETVTVTQEEVAQMQAEAPAAPAPPAAEPAAPAAEPAEEVRPTTLPSTASPLPLLLALGAGLVGTGAGLSLLRRR